MLKRLAPLVPIALSMVLAACANHSPQPQPELATQPAVFSSTALAEFDEQAKEAALGDFTEEKSYKLPQLADSILSHGLSLVGTRYRFGGGSVSSGFDCSGFIGYLFKEEAGMQLPRSSRDMINIDAPLVSRDELEPGDLLFFDTTWRSGHVGIYVGGGDFVHAPSSGKRVMRGTIREGYFSRRLRRASRFIDR